MSNKKPVMSHDPLAGLDESEAAGEVVVVPEAAKLNSAAQGVKDEAGVLVLESSLTIADVAAYQAVLQNALDLGGPKRVDGRDVEVIDGAGLQLLTAFVKEMTEKAQQVSWLGVSENLERAARQFGVYNALHLDRSDDKAA
jgi:anti-anti-sigma regulatory factor